MKPHTLPVKRVPANKSIFRRLSAVTGNRRQRVAAAAAAAPADLESDETGSKISRALTVIFLIHIVVIGLIFFHQKYMAGRAPDVGKPEAGPGLAAATAAIAPAHTELPRLSSGEKPYIVRPGDNYGRIAAELEVDEQDLRVLNKHVDISQGLILRIPSKRIVAEEPPEVAAIRAQMPIDEDSGLVEAVDVTNAPKAQLVRPKVVPGTQPRETESARSFEPVAASGKTHLVQQGDSIFRIASRYNVDQKALMRANSITDPRKMKIGMKLVIPAN
jgi:LysM repeat protein